MNEKRFFRVCLIALTLLALLSASAMAKVAKYNDDYFYLDEAGVMSTELEGEIYFANKLLTDACGGQIVVAAIKSTGRQAIDEYAYDMFNEWGIGDASRNNGFLLLLAIDDDDYYYMTGEGIDRKLSNGTLKQMRDEYLEPEFARKNYELGVKQFFEAVFASISQMYNTGLTIDDAIRAYESYVASNSAQNGFGGYTGSRRGAAVNPDYRGYDEDEDFGIGMGTIVLIVLIIVFVVVMSKGSRARRRMVIMPPPPPPPRGFGGIGYRPTRTIFHSGPRVSSGWSSGSGRSSFGGSSSFGGGSSRSSFGSSSRSSGGFGGGHGGGGRTAGGGGGRGRH